MECLMPRGIYQTNPLGIIDLTNECIELSVNRNSLGIIDNISFTKFELKKISQYKSFPLNSDIILKVSNNYDDMRINLGTINSPNYFREKKIEIEGSKSNLKYFLFIRNNYKIIASNENFKPFDPKNSNPKGLIKVEPDNLGEISWRVQPLDGSSEPILKVNSDRSKNLLFQLKSNASVRALIFMNALEQILFVVAKYPGSEDWHRNWETYLDKEGINIFDGESETEALIWAEETANFIANKLALFSNWKLTTGDSIHA